MISLVNNHASTFHYLTGKALTDMANVVKLSLDATAIIHNTALLDEETNALTSFTITHFPTRSKGTRIYNSPFRDQGFISVDQPHFRSTSRLPLASQLDEGNS
jgi:hypothetical protein